MVAGRRLAKDSTGRQRTALGVIQLFAVGVDACVVATPSPDHLPTAMALAEAGIPTLIEKPLGMDPDECAQIAAAFTHAGVLAAVGHVERFHTAVRQLQVDEKAP